MAKSASVNEYVEELLVHEAEAARRNSEITHIRQHLDMAMATARMAE